MRWVLVLLATAGALAMPGAAVAAPPGNDAFDDATAISTLPFSETVDLTEATFEGSEPPGCYYSPNKSIWYTLAPATDMVIEVEASGSFDRSIAVFRDTGGGITGLDRTTCGYPWTPTVARLQGGETYYIQAAYQFSTGDFHLEVTEIPAPVNDHFANAMPVSAVGFSDTQNYAASTLEPGEPSPTPSCSSGVQNSTWYAFTAPADGAYTVGTQSNSWPTLVFYHGTSLGDLDEIDCVTASGARRSFHADVGQVTYIRVSDPNNGNNGAVTVTLDAAPDPVADFWHTPWDPSRFDTITFYGNSSDPGGNPITEQHWDFGDGSSADGCCPQQHRFARDGDYEVTITVTTSDGRTNSATRVVQVRTHDVSIAKLTVPQAVRAGQTRTITVGIANANYPENVTVTLYRSTAGGWYEQVGQLTQTVPVRGKNRTTAFSIIYTFTEADKGAGKVTFKAVASVQYPARDAFPADNEVIALPTTVT